MDISVALAVLGLVLAILAAIPPLRDYFLLNIAVVILALSMVLTSGAIRT